MPLHLLGKKSWNVYNTDNIAKVRHDEASAKAREEEENQRMQEVDAERRIQILRGLVVEPPAALPKTKDPKDRKTDSRRDTKRRRIAGEDDTDRDIRLAKDSSLQFPATVEPHTFLPARKSITDVPLLDQDGHINLFPEGRSSRQTQKNPEAEAEVAKKKREYEDQYTMRFSNAAGSKQDSEEPWYSSLGGLVNEHPSHDVGKNVWGKEDRGRKERERARRDDIDPMSTIKKGVEGLREVERERKRSKQERDKDIWNIGLRSGSKRRWEDPPIDLHELSLAASVRQAESERSTSHHQSGGTQQQSRGRHHSDRSYQPYHRNDATNSQGGNNDRHSTRKINNPASSFSKHCSSSSTENVMVKMRMERNERERKERLKTGTLLEKLRTDAQPGWERGARGRYSSQFTRS
ncbi:MAG: hypothetical protein M1827_007103 [Pycnora praestabilis]|nr:MAG: hypothetical protein M1827_007103 [Pycnora praestabilis]